MSRDFLPLAQALSVALKSVQMYTAAHPRSQEGLKGALAALQPWLEEEPQLQVVAANGKAFANGHPVDGHSPHLANLVKLLSDHQVAGLIFHRGTALADLQALAEALLLKPQRMEELGGLSEILQSKGVASIRVSNVKYREVREGEGEGGSGAEGAAPIQAPGAAQPPSAPASAPPLASGFNARDSGGWALPQRKGGTAAVAPSEQLVAIVRSSLLRVLPPPKVRPGVELPPGTLDLEAEPADLRSLGQMGYELGLGDEMPTTIQLGVLRQVLMDLPAERQMSILAGLSTLPERPQGLALGIKALASEILAVAISSLVGRGMPLEFLAAPIQEILAPLPDRSAMVQALGIQIRGLGLPIHQTESMIQRLEWAALTPEAKLVRVLDEGRLFELSLEQRLALLRELLDSGRHESLLRVEERLLESLSSDRPELRLHAAQTLAGMCVWAVDPGLPPAVEGPLDQALRAHFGWEPDPLIHQITTEGLERLFLVLLRRGQLTLLQEELLQLQNHAAMLNEAHPWRTEALGRLKASLQRPEALEAAAACLFVGDKEHAASFTGPYFDLIGGPMVRHLIQILGREQDRARRGRIMDALRAFGPFAVTFLREALQTPVPWFLLRNLMGLLSELGDASAIPELLPNLRHAEPRVRRAAVRATWKLGGPAGEPHLIALLKEADPETKFEIVFGLGQLRSEASVPALVELAEDRRAPETLRLKVLETLAFIQSPRSVPPLAELAKRKGFFGTNEPASIRLAAAKVLGAVHPSGRQALKELAEAEPKSDLRDAFLALLR